MGEQIDGMGEILERTVEKLEEKADKLDHNFTYLYEKMTNIEFDNASFKDKLSHFIVETPKIHENYQTSMTSGANQLLSTLTQYTEGHKMEKSFPY